MSNFKPDLSAKVTIRCSKRSRTRFHAISKKHDIAEAETLRHLLNAGLALAEKKGIGYVMEIEDRLRAEEKKGGKVSGAKVGK